MLLLCFHSFVIIWNYLIRFILKYIEKGNRFSSLRSIVAYNHPCRKFINSYRAPIVQFMIPGKSDIDINQERKGLRKKEGEKKTRFISREEDEKGDGEE